MPAVAVYDITVDGAPEFFANGVLVHNSPVPLGGGMFKDHYFNQRVKAAPYQAKRVRYWDRAATQDGGCFTAGVLMAKDSDGNYYVEHCTWGQWEPYERNQRMLATAIRDRGRYGPRNEPVIHVEAEGGSSGKDAFKGVVKALAGFYVKEDRVTGDKVTRANPWSAQLAAKNVYFVDDGSWDLDAYVREHCSFPLGKYKDQVDASSGAFNLLTGMRTDVSIQCVQIRPKGPRDGLRLVIATPENLKTVVVEEKALLVRFRGLLDADEPLTHGIVNLLDTLDLRFEPIHPPDHQETWDDPIPPLNLPVADLMMSWDHGKKLWAFLLKKRDPPASAVVFVCDKDRAEAACYAVCDKLRPRLLKTPRPQIYRVGQGSEERHEGEAVNKHVYDTVRACRNLVVA